MRAKSDGFELQFTGKIDPASLEEAFTMSRYTYLYSSAYGGDEIETAELVIREVIPDDDGRTVRLVVEGMTTGFVHELRTSGLKSVAGTPLDFPNAYYTLNCLPK